MTIGRRRNKILGSRRRYSEVICESVSPGAGFSVIPLKMQIRQNENCVISKSRSTFLILLQVWPLQKDEESCFDRKTGIHKRLPECGVLKEIKPNGTMLWISRIAFHCRRIVC